MLSLRVANPAFVKEFVESELHHDKPNEIGYRFDPVQLKSPLEVALLEVFRHKFHYGMVISVVSTSPQLFYKLSLPLARAFKSRGKEDTGKIFEPCSEDGCGYILDSAGEIDQAIIAPNESIRRLGVGTFGSYERSIKENDCLGELDRLVGSANLFIETCYKRVYIRKFRDHSISFNF